VPNAGSDSGTLATNAGHQVLVGSDPVTATNAANRDYAQPVFSALDSDDGFLEVSNGFAGSDSDGLTQLDASHKLTADHTDAANGNLVQTARIDLGRWDDFTLALGFGSDQASALAAAHDTLRKPLNDVIRDYATGWHNYNAGLVQPHRPHGVSGHDWDKLVDEYYTSADYVKAAGDKTFPGAEAAALTSPWGQAIEAGNPQDPGTYFGSYREVFARDLYEAWTSAYLEGDRRAARDMTTFLFERQQQADGSMPRNSLTNGKPAPDSFNNQLDEDSYPLIMALAVGLTDHDFYANHIAPAANFVAAHGPIGGPERWEEQDGYSPSTMSAEITGLLAAAEIADRNHDTASARLWRGVADEFQRHLKQWTLTTNGPLSAQPYFIRLSKTGDPNAAISYNVGNGGPTLDQRSVIDAGFLEYARLGIFKPSDQDIVNSLPVVDKTIAHDTASGQGFLRYNGDGYGDGFQDGHGVNGHPWAGNRPAGSPGCVGSDSCTNKGTGHVWPVLTGERGEYEISRGQLSAAIGRLQTMRDMAGGVGLIPEQAWDEPNLAPDVFGSDPTNSSIGFTNGKPAGSAAALTWSAGQYVRLMLDVSAAKVLDRPAYTVKRYIDHTQGTTALTVTAPADRSAVTGSTTVTGTALPGASIVVRGVNLDDHSAVTGTATAAQDGSWSVPLTLTGGTTVLNTVATDKHGGTARDKRTVVFDFAPGKLLFEAIDPDGDDNGPGNYAYPKSDNFKPGAYDLEQFQVYDDAANNRIIFRVRTRDLTPTFGSPLGAQLVDVYVHVPGAATTSTDPSFGIGARHYTIAPAGAWSRLIEVQGFGQRYLDASGATLGQVSISGNDVSRYITFSVSKASLGQPGPGWGFTVVLHGQDGFSSDGDQARQFQPTPQDFQFGECATASSDPHCTFAANQLPKAMDVFAPPGVAQSDELDYTKQSPVVIQPVVMP
jgi:glucoamylase